MKRRPWRSKVRKWLYSSGLLSVWGGLAIAQILLLGLLYWTWAPISLTLVVPASEIPYWSTLIQEFEADHPNIRIRPIGLDNPQGDITVNLKALCTLEIPQRSLCDLIYLDVIWVPELAARGWLQNLNGRLSDAELEKFLASEVAAGRYDNSLYRVPFRADFGMLYYRRDLLNQVGYAPPQTFQELLAIAQDLQTQGAAPWGFLWQNQREGLVTTFVEVLHGHGGFWIDSDTQAVGLDQPQAIAAVEFLVNTIESGVSPPISNGYTDEAAFVAFLDDQAVFMRNWPFVFNQGLNQGLDPDTAELSLPSAIERMPMTLHADGYTGQACKGSWGLGIARRSRHPDQAWEAVEYFTSEAAQRQFIQNTSYIPSRKTLLSDATLAAAAQEAVLRPPIADYAQASLILQTHLRQALSGQVDAAIAMAAAAQETRQILNASEFTSP